MNSNTKPEAQEDLAAQIVQALDNFHLTRRSCDRSKADDVRVVAACLAGSANPQVLEEKAEADHARVDGE